MYVRVYYANCIRLYKVIDTGSPLINIIKRIKRFLNSFGLLAKGKMFILRIKLSDILACRLVFKRLKWEEEPVVVVQVSPVKWFDWGPFGDENVGMVRWED